MVASGGNNWLTVRIGTRLVKMLGNGMCVVTVVRVLVARGRDGGVRVSIGTGIIGVFMVRGRGDGIWAVVGTYVVRVGRENGCGGVGIGRSRRVGLSMVRGRFGVARMDFIGIGITLISWRMWFTAHILRQTLLTF